MGHGHHWGSCALLVLCLGCSQQERSEEKTATTRSSATAIRVPVPEPVADPAHVAGRWLYRTRSNCGTVEGVGELLFEWLAGEERYWERGCVYWADSKNTIYWWGKQRFDEALRTLTGRNQNSLGDEVDGHWTLKGAGPDRLVVSWQQTNGCHGEGIATRPSADKPSADAVRKLTQTHEYGLDAGPCSADEAGPHRWPDRRRR